MGRVLDSQAYAKWLDTFLPPAYSDDFQVYVCNPAAVGASGCSWNNVQSTQGAASGAQAQAIRIGLKLPEGEITRDRELPRW